MEEILLKIMYMKNKEVFADSQRGFTEGTPRPTNVGAFCGGVTVGWGKIEDQYYLPGFMQCIWHCLTSLNQRHMDVIDV